MSEENEGENWKPIYTLNKDLKTLIEKIAATLQAIIDATDDKDEMTHQQLQMLLGDSWIVSAKLAGAQGAYMYTIYMENTSIIRSLMRQMKTSTYGLESEALMDKEKGVEQNYIEVFREEIEEFRTTFKRWVSYFEIDEFEDEWGLYL